MFANGENGTFNAPIVPRSSTPALLGNKALRRNRAIMDCHNGIIYFIGPGGYQILLPPGSQEYKLELSDSGHWMLPVTEYAAAAAASKKGAAAVQGLQLLHASVAPKE